MNTYGHLALYRNAIELFYEQKAVPSLDFAACLKRPKMLGSLTERHPGSRKEDEVFNGDEQVAPDQVDVNAMVAAVVDMAGCRVANPSYG
mmetsp:Transcript_27325/g.40020  ORF Transcript_27325/g.40020 Transcript_27325/m.40020 type:complete len:90 (+) Transcript_27325:262-531(+)